ncbi:MAG: hypothetical protein WDW38_006385 [Sanguina aurantia]
MSPMDAAPTCCGCVTTGDSVRKGHLSCLRRQLQSRCTRETMEHLADVACQVGSAKCLREICEHAAKTSVKLVVWNGLSFALRDDHLDCIRTLLEMGVGIHNAMQNAARFNHLPAMRLMKEFGVPFTDLAVWGASKHGHLECLIYAREQGAPWYPTTTSVAAACRDMACLVYAHEHGAPWCENTALFATRGYGGVAALEYALDHGAELSPLATQAAAYLDRGGHLRVLVERGCPYSDPSSTHIRRNRDSVLEGRTRRRSAITIQRAWRTTLDARRRRAVAVIEDAYITWSCRPHVGRWYVRTCQNFQAHSLALA